ncbi:MAG: hypothetical protein ACLP4W_11260 [Mycobacterium sp.]
MSYVNAHNDLHGEFGAYHCQRPRRSAADCQVHDMARVQLASKPAQATPV